MKFNDYIFNYERIVIGSCLRAALFAAINDLPILFSYPSPPCSFDFLDPELDLDRFNFVNQRSELKTLSGRQKVVGSQKRLFWSLLHGALGMAGRSPMSSKCTGLRLEGDGQIRASTLGSRFARMRFEELIVFDSNMLHFDNELLKVADYSYRVIDWIKIRKGKEIRVEYINTEDQFVKEVYFYPTEFLNRFDIAAISELSREQLDSFEYSDTMARFKVWKMIKENNLYTGLLHNTIIETTNRQVIKTGQNLYKDSSMIVFNHDSLEKILNMKPSADNHVLEFVNKIRQDRYAK